MSVIWEEKSKIWDIDRHVAPKSIRRAHLGGLGNPFAALRTEQGGDGQSLSQKGSISEHFGPPFTRATTHQETVEVLCAVKTLDLGIFSATYGHHV